MHFDTISIHAGNISDKAGSVVQSINLATTFERDEDGNIGGKGYIYTRMGNPNRQVLEIKVALLEGGVEAFAFPSGMSAAMALAQTILKPGNHVIIPDDCYHGVAHLIKAILPKWNISYTEVDMTNPINVEKAIQQNTVLIILETPSNPMLKITDIEAVCRIAKSKNILTGCDNTWCTPLIQRPFELGADFVFHSTTKFFGGHSDVLGGCIIAREHSALTTEMREYQITGGAVPSPFDCWLLNRSLATMSLRLKKQVENASQIALFLKSHPKIEDVFYPGLPSHPGHEIAKKQMHGLYGSMISILIKGGKSQALKFGSSTKLFKHATSLGGVESLLEHRRSAEGNSPRSPDNLLRLSIGIEYIDDLVDDLLNGLASI